MSSVGDSLAEIFDVRDTRILVTGAASGLGLAIAEAVVQAGAVVTLADIDEPGLQKQADRLSGFAGKVRSEVLDVGDGDAVRAAIDKVVRVDGRIDAVFANAAGGPASPAQDRDTGVVAALDSAWHHELAVHLNGTVATVRAAARAMIEQENGSIVLTSSTAGLRADPHVPYSYATVKGAMLNFARQAALELAPHGIRVNVIAPGPFRTNIGAKAHAAGFTITDKDWARTVPLGRTGDPAELKGLALLLGSKAGSFITGAVYPIDGGAMLTSAI